MLWGEITCTLTCSINFCWRSFSRRNSSISSRKSCSILAWRFCEPCSSFSSNLHNTATYNSLISSAMSFQILLYHGSQKQRFKVLNEILVCFKGLNMIILFVAFPRIGAEKISFTRKCDITSPKRLLHVNWHL